MFPTCRMKLLELSQSANSQAASMVLQTVAKSVCNQSGHSPFHLRCTVVPSLHIFSIYIYRYFKYKVVSSIKWNWLNTYHLRSCISFTDMGCPAKMKLPFDKVSVYVFSLSWAMMGYALPLCKSINVLINSFIFYNQQRRQWLRFVMAWQEIKSMHVYGYHC
jgi:hypothetical protein